MQCTASRLRTNDRRADRRRAMPQNIAASTPLTVGHTLHRHVATCQFLVEGRTTPLPIFPKQPL